MRTVSDYRRLAPTRARSLARGLYSSWAVVLNEVDSASSSKKMCESVHAHQMSLSRYSVVAARCLRCHVNAPGHCRYSCTVVCSFSFTRGDTSCSCQVCISKFEVLEDVNGGTGENPKLQDLKICSSLSMCMGFYLYKHYWVNLFGWDYWAPFMTCTWL